MATKKSKKFCASMAKGADELRFEPYELRSGEVVASLRVFYQDKKTSEWKPGKQGLTLSRDQIPEFVKNLKALYNELPESESEPEGE